MKIAILGAGLTGVELGRRLKESGKDFIIFEKEPQIGGLCRTNKTGNYCWDFGVHAMYSRDKEVMNYFYSLPLDYEHLNRNVKIIHSLNNGKRCILDYPFEIGLKGLPAKQKLKCILGYLSSATKVKKQYSNLEDWINNRLGSGIAKYFMVPYNNKIWSCKLSEISKELVSSKIEPAPAIEFILNALGKPSVGRAYQAKFIYPKHGIQELINHTAKNIKYNILLNTNIKKLIKQGDQWTIITDKNNNQKVDTIVSTIPLPELLKKIDINGLEKEYNELKWNDTFFIAIGLKKGCRFDLIKDCHWVFFKESEIFYRITLMHNFSSKFLPVVVAEVTLKGNIINKSKEEIKNLVIEDFVRLGIINSRDQIAEADIKLLKYTYSIPAVGLEKIKKKIRIILEKHKLFLLGRNGNWDYINMDGVIQKVKEFCEQNTLFR